MINCYCTRCELDFQIVDTSNSLFEYPSSVYCPECKNPASFKGKSTAATVMGCDSFNPHYDKQLGKHFGTKEERDAHLKSKNLVGEGTSSPRISTPTRVICTNGQATKGEQGGKI